MRRSPDIRASVSDVLKQCGRFYPRPVSVKFVLCKMTKGAVCLQVLRSSCVNIFPKMLVTCYHLQVGLNRGNPEEAWDPVKDLSRTSSRFG